jgi:hypothetical protein
MSEDTPAPEAPSGGSIVPPSWAWATDAIASISAQMQYIDMKGIAASLAPAVATFPSLTGAVLSTAPAVAAFPSLTGAVLPLPPLLGASFDAASRADAGRISIRPSEPALIPPPRSDLELLREVAGLRAQVKTLTKESTAMRNELAAVHAELRSMQVPPWAGEPPDHPYEN